MTPRARKAAPGKLDRRKIRAMAERYGQRHASEEEVYLAHLTEFGALVARQVRLEERQLRLAALEMRRK